MRVDVKAQQTGHRTVHAAKSTQSSFLIMVALDRCVEHGGQGGTVRRHHGTFYVRHVEV
jgi:hypothetical protein